MPHHMLENVTSSFYCFESIGKAQKGRRTLPELPFADGLIRERREALRQHFFNVAEAMFFNKHWRSRRPQAKSKWIER
jgi:hypothetical protein